MRQPYLLFKRSTAAKGGRVYQVNQQRFRDQMLESDTWAVSYQSQYRNPLYVKYRLVDKTYYP